MALKRLLAALALVRSCSGSREHQQFNTAMSIAVDGQAIRVGDPDWATPLGTCLLPNPPINEALLQEQLNFKGNPTSSEEESLIEVGGKRTGAVKYNIIPSFPLLSQYCVGGVTQSLPGASDKSKCDAPSGCSACWATTRTMNYLHAGTSLNATDELASDPYTTGAQIYLQGKCKTGWVFSEDQCSTKVPGDALGLGGKALMLSPIGYRIATDYEVANPAHVWAAIKDARAAGMSLPIGINFAYWDTPCDPPTLAGSRDITHFMTIVGTGQREGTGEHFVAVADPLWRDEAGGCGQVLRTSASSVKEGESVGAIKVYSINKAWKYRQTTNMLHGLKLDMALTEIRDGERKEVIKTLESKKYKVRICVTGMYGVQER